ncbi:MAG: hypothetical protein KF744_04885 [Taibaiella sp.]|nr:hypothetical protein [Taibaiella sp.]
MKADGRQSESAWGYRILSSRAGNWITVRDILLAPEQSARTTASANCVHMFLPVVGAVSLNSAIQHIEVSPEEILTFGTTDTMAVEMTNPNPDETINLLHISFSDNDPLLFQSPSLSQLPIVKRNVLAASDGFASSVHAGVYDSRVKSRFTMREAGNSLLCYVINGAFEVEDRLLEHRDALFFPTVEEVEFESLSETAIILLIECSPIK